MEPAAMESPLDVLSRAASLVETSSRLLDLHNNSSINLHNCAPSPPVNGNNLSYRDDRASAGKELPTKSLKQERVRERQEMTFAVDHDRELAERLNYVKKTTSTQTQTQFSSFMRESSSAHSSPPPPPPYHTNHDTIYASHHHQPQYSHPHPSALSSQSYSRPPPPCHPAYYSQPAPNSNPVLDGRASPPSSRSHSHTQGSRSPGLGSPPSLAACSTPLSSSSSPSSSFKPFQSQQSVPYTAHHSRHHHRHHQHHHHLAPSPPIGVTPSLPPVPASHRSTPPPPPPPLSLPPYLGLPLPPPHYHTEIAETDIQHAPLNLSISSSLKPADGIQLPSTNQRVAQNLNCSSADTSITVSQESESIEEHFRRSLGKSYTETSSTDSPQPSPSPTRAPGTQAVEDKICSVDDHFARALGDQMWTEIKARTEDTSIESLPNTVDAHFAKALGANIWQKLKTEGKTTTGVGGEVLQQLPKKLKHPHPQQQQKKSRQPANSRLSPVPTPMMT